MAGKISSCNLPRQMRSLILRTVFMQKQLIHFLGVLFTLRNKYQNKEGKKKHI